MRAGLLKENIEIWQKSLTTNDYGEETEIWSLKYSTKARLVHNGGSRVIENEEVFFSHTKTFEVRDYVPVDDYDRIVWNNKKYRILNIEPDRTQMKLTIKAELIDD
jgi:head-tail adaptor